MKVIEIRPLHQGMDAISVVELDGSLESLQEAVGGLIELAPAPASDFPYLMLTDEEGMLKGKDINSFGHAGITLLLKNDEDDPTEMRGLTDKEIDFFYNVFSIAVGEQ
ncbi:DUF3846 domain-containing protein (plasmid) [Halobacillus litoralis]|uniref:DUF3846 domain-containing protein n=1 Tax=Halobacillus litoralis TaxID=45668 RepID=UPI001CFDA208|nr:DUF3846 domain-containing protein [Halobacillus litoralis]WLR49576.1 DUF3846 domain-containing protein [Halobacillus litoralis]